MIEKFEGLSHKKRLPKWKSRLAPKFSYILYTVFEPLLRRGSCFFIQVHLFLISRFYEKNLEAICIFLSAGFPLSAFELSDFLNFLWALNDGVNGQTSKTEKLPNQIFPNRCSVHRCFTKNALAGQRTSVKLRFLCRHWHVSLFSQCGRLC